VTDMGELCDTERVVVKRCQLEASISPLDSFCVQLLTTKA
jgi:hypothetical protein